MKRKSNVLKQRDKKPIKIGVEIRITISRNILVLKISEKATEKNKKIISEHTAFTNAIKPCNTKQFAKFPEHLKS